MGELIIKKRDNIPPETVTAWFKDFKNRGWDKKKFDQQFEKVISGVTYGVVKIDDFLKEEKTYTQKEAEDLANRKINELISDANLLMKHYKIEIEINFDVPIQKTAVKVMVANKLLKLLERVEKETNLDIIDECFDLACERLDLNLQTVNDSGKIKTTLRKVL